MATPDDLARFLGRSARLDYLASLLVSELSPDIDDDVTESLGLVLRQAGGSGRLTAAALDLATDCGLRPLSAEELFGVIERSPSSQVRRSALRHLSSMADVIPAANAETLCALVKPAPFEIPTCAMAAKSLGCPPAAIVSALAHTGLDVGRFFAPPNRVPRIGSRIMQFALWGSLARPGEGNSGGLGVYLSSLGDSLADQPGVAEVVTVRLIDADEAEQIPSWTECRRSGHLVLSLPVDSGAPDFSFSELAWWLRTLVQDQGIQPDIAHFRFLDDATLAVARATALLGARSVMTVAPDPHRMLLNRHIGGSGQLDATALGDDLHRVFVGEVLSEWVDGAVAIAGGQQPSETPAYFPDVVRRFTGAQLPAIPEGIPPFSEATGDDARLAAAYADLFKPHPPFGLDREYWGSTVLLNVGRWSPVKQQDVLVEAWLASGLIGSTVLVLIGGSDSQPGAEELQMRGRIIEMVSGHPHAAGRFTWLPQMGNHEVRLLERALAVSGADHAPHSYVCASRKEEFGIAILEAMEAGMLALAPRVGGADYYIRPADTGFLVDTSSAGSLAADMSQVFAGGIPADRLRAIAAAGQKTVRAELGIANSARQLNDYYKSLMSPHGTNGRPPSAKAHPRRASQLLRNQNLAG